MGKNSQNESSNRFVIDTSYLLPLVGIEVEGLDDDTINKIFRLKLYYPSSLIPELVGVIIKEVKRNRLDEIPKEVVEGLNSIIYGGFVELIQLEGEDVKTIYDLIKDGCNDIFDAILYATGKRLGIKVLSMDKSFKKFLKEQGYYYEIIVDHTQIG